MDIEQLISRLRNKKPLGTPQNVIVDCHEVADAIESLQLDLSTIPDNCVHIQLDSNGMRVVGIRCKDEAQLPLLNELGQDLARGW